MSGLTGIFQDLLGDSWGDILGGGAAAGMLYKAYDDIGDIGTRGLQLGQDLANLQLEQTQFRPYTVTTGTGGQFSATADGSTMALSPEQQAFYQQMFGGAGSMFQNAMQGTADREAAIFQRMQDAMRPEMERQQSALDRKLAAQGRLGVRTEEFGGTPEQLALSKAQEEARYNAMLSAMGQAQAEQAQQAALGSQFLGASFMPQQQMLAALSPGLTAAGQQQQAQMYGAGLFGEATASGIDALLGSAMGRANMIGAAGSGLLGGIFGRKS
jgi:hypothetical protein